MEGTALNESAPTYAGEPVTPAATGLDGAARPLWPSDTILLPTDLNVLRRRAERKRERDARRDGRRQRAQQSGRR